MKTKPRVSKVKELERRLRLFQTTLELIKNISDPVRLSVVLMLESGERHVGSISETLGMTQPAVSHHLALLRHGQIIIPRRQGRNVYYGLTETGRVLAEAARIIDG